MADDVPAGYQNDGGFKSVLFIHTNKETHDRGVDMLKLFGLREPVEGQFRVGKHALRIYMPSAGVTFSFPFQTLSPVQWISSRVFRRPIDPAKTVFGARKLKDDRLIHPLASKDLSNVGSIEILPMLKKLPASPDEITTFVKGLKADGINIHTKDVAEVVANVELPEVGARRTILFNRRACELTRKFAASNIHAPEAQTQELGPLIEQFSEALHRENGALAARAMQEACAEAGARHRLHPDSFMRPINDRDRQNLLIAQKYEDLAA